MSSRPAQFASKTGVGTTGLFLCSNANHSRRSCVSCELWLCVRLNFFSVLFFLVVVVCVYVLSLDCTVTAGGANDESGCVRHGRIYVKKTELDFRLNKVSCWSSKSKQLFHSQAVPMAFHYFSAATHNERRFQFRLRNHLFRIVPDFMGKSLVIAVRMSKLNSRRYLNNSNLPITVH